MINMPGIKNPEPFSSFALPTILSPSKNNEVAENELPNTFKTLETATGRPLENIKLPATPSIVITKIGFNIMDFIVFATNNNFPFKILRSVR